MQHGCLGHLLCTWLLLLGLAIQARSKGTFGLKLIHKYSDEAKELMKARNTSDLETWPSFGSTKYYQILHKEDRARRARKLSKFDTLIFFESNETLQLGGTFGGLFYTLVDVGTPDKTFLVALDTGSDLFWVPCQCKRCSPLHPRLNTYSPAKSATSKPVSCNNTLCTAAGSCQNGRSLCSYSLDYVSGNSSGVLVEDVIKFSPGDLFTPSTVDVPIVFGCGEMQSGAFLDGSSDGILGLGLGEVSVPSILAKRGLVQNSFSMCFSLDGAGRLFLGDKGHPAQQTTSFLSSNHSLTSFAHYFVELEAILVGNRHINQTTQMIFDSGTSFTYFRPALYQAVTKAYDSQINLARIPTSSLHKSQIPFEFCYTISTNDITNYSYPNVSISFSFTGGGNFTLASPYVGLFNEKSKALLGICLSILPGSIPIIGVNSMVGYWVVFDREAMMLGWIPSDCAEEATGARPTASPGLAPEGSTPFGSTGQVGSPSPSPQYSSAPLLPPTPFLPPSPTSALSQTPSSSNAVQNSSGAASPIAPANSGSGGNKEPHLILLLSSGLIQFLLMKCITFGLLMDLSSV